MTSPGGQEWCAFTSKAKAQRAAADAESDAMQTAWIIYRGKSIQSIVITTEGEDADTEDSYYFDAQLRLIRIIRTGSYFSSPSFSVTYQPNIKGPFALTAQSKAIIRQQVKLKRETYFVDWPYYSSFGAIPFHKLITTSPTISVTERCVKMSK